MDTGDVVFFFIGIVLAATVFWFLGAFRLREPGPATKVDVRSVGKEVEAVRQAHTQELEEIKTELQKLENKEAETLEVGNLATKEDLRSIGREIEAVRHAHTEELEEIKTELHVLSRRSAKVLEASDTALVQFFESSLNTLTACTGFRVRRAADVYGRVDDQTAEARAAFEEHRRALLRLKAYFSASHELTANAQQASDALDGLVVDLSDRIRDLQSRFKEHDDALVEGKIAAEEREKASRELIGAFNHELSSSERLHESVRQFGLFADTLRAYLQERGIEAPIGPIEFDLPES